MGNEDDEIIELYIDENIDIIESYMKAYRCTCGAYKITEDDKILHVADCCCDN